MYPIFKNTKVGIDDIGDFNGISFFAISAADSRGRSRFIDWEACDQYEGAMECEQEEEDVESVASDDSFSVLTEIPICWLLKGKKEFTAYPVGNTDETKKSSRMECSHSV